MRLGARGIFAAAFESSVIRECTVGELQHRSRGASTVDGRDVDLWLLHWERIVPMKGGGRLAGRRHSVVPIITTMDVDLAAAGDAVCRPEVKPYPAAA